MKPPVILIGGGGHARVVADVLRLLDYEIVGVTTREEDREAANSLDIPWLGDDGAVDQHSADSVLLANGVGSTHTTKRRREIYGLLTERGYRFAVLVHPSAVVAESARLADGVQIMAGAVVQPGTEIGANSIVNTGARIDHDCQIGSGVHIAPGSVLSGGVQVGDGVHFGTAAAAIQQVRIGTGSLIGAGAVVTRDVPAGGFVASPPCDVTEKRDT